MAKMPFKVISYERYDSDMFLHVAAVQAVTFAGNKTTITEEQTYGQFFSDEWPDITEGDTIELSKADVAILVLMEKQ